MCLGALQIMDFLHCQLILMKLQRKLFLSVGEVELPGRAGEGAGGQGLCLPCLSVEAAWWRNCSTLRPQRPLSSPSPRGAELRNPATAHHSRLGTEEVSTAPGALASTIWLPFPTCCHLPSPVALTLQHCSTSATACHHHLCWNSLNKWYVAHILSQKVEQCNSAKVRSLGFYFGHYIINLSRFGLNHHWAVWQILMGYTVFSNNRELRVYMFILRQTVEFEEENFFLCP